MLPKAPWSLEMSLKVTNYCDAMNMSKKHVFRIATMQLYKHGYLCMSEHCTGLSIGNLSYSILNYPQANLRHILKFIEILYAADPDINICDPQEVFFINKHRSIEGRISAKDHGRWQCTLSKHGSDIEMSLIYHDQTGPQIPVLIYHK